MHKQARSHTLWTSYILPLPCTYRDNVLYIFFNLHTTIHTIFRHWCAIWRSFLLNIFLPSIFALSWWLFLTLFSYFTPTRVNTVCCTHVMLHKLSSAYLSKPLIENIWSKTTFVCGVEYFGHSFVVWRLFAVTRQFQFIGRQSIYLKKLGAVIAHPLSYQSPTERTASSVSVTLRRCSEAEHFRLRSVWI